jgi:hypothetical protein
LFLGQSALLGFDERGDRLVTVLGSKSPPIHGSCDFVTRQDVQDSVAEHRAADGW